MSPSLATVARWHQSLKFLRFYYAVGGHANDADTIFGRILFSGEAQLLQIFAQWGIPLQRIPAGAERVIPGKAYTPEAYAQVAHPIRDYPAYQEPSITCIWGIQLYLEVHQADIAMHLSGANGDPWSVSEKDFKQALKIEAECERLGMCLAIADKT